MRKSESPRTGIQGQRKTEKANGLMEKYLSPPAGVNRKCSSCGYFRQVEQARRNRVFCRFTGETVSPGMTCDFWTLAEVAHADI